MDKNGWETPARSLDDPSQLAIGVFAIAEVPVYPVALPFPNIARAPIWAEQAINVKLVGHCEIPLDASKMKRGRLMDGQLFGSYPSRSFSLRYIATNGHIAPFITNIAYCKS